MVRMREMIESVKIIRQCLAMIPAADSDHAHRAKVPRNLKPPAGEVYVETENPRGALGFFIESRGEAIPYRLKVRAPTFNHLSAVRAICRDCLLADIPVIIGSIDIVMGQVDR